MKCCEPMLLCKQLLAAAVSLILGIVAGLLFPVHFENPFPLYWIAIGIALFVFVFLMISTLAVRGGSAFARGIRCHLAALTVGTGGLLTTAVLNVTLAVVRDTLHSVLFGMTVGFLAFLLLSAFLFIYSFLRSVHRETAL